MMFCTTVADLQLPGWASREPTEQRLWTILQLQGRCQGRPPLIAEEAFVGS
jgi:hypothetical protein